MFVSIHTIVGIRSNLASLQVRYDLLDCHHSFYESVKKLIGVMETGMVKGGEALVPHLFQFLVLLASDQSKLMTIPQVSEGLTNTVLPRRIVL